MQLDAGADGEDEVEVDEEERVDERIDDEHPVDGREGDRVRRADVGHREAHHALPVGAPVGGDQPVKRREGNGRTRKQGWI